MPGYPKNHEETCDRVRPYLEELTAWLTRRQKEIDDLKGAPLKRGQDPPPKPPDLGP